MVHAINDGLIGYKASCHEKLQIVLVDKEERCIEKHLKVFGSLEGCSVLMDVWKDCQDRPLVNTIVSSIFAPYILKAMDCLG